MYVGNSDKHGNDYYTVRIKQVVALSSNETKVISSIQSIGSTRY